MNADPRSLFRKEALEHHTRGGLRGDVLRLTPRSFFFVHWLLIALAVAVVVFASVGQIDEYAIVPATWPGSRVRGSCMTSASTYRTLRSSRFDRTTIRRSGVGYKTRIGSRMP